MLNERIRPEMSKEFYPEPTIGVAIRDDPIGSLGSYSSPKQDGHGGWTNGTFLFDGSKPHQL